MVQQALLIAAAGAIALTGGLSKGGKSKKVIDLTGGVVRDLIIGAGGGAAINYIDNLIANGSLQQMRVGNAAPGQNLNVTDGVLMLGTSGLVKSKKELTRFAPFLVGKKGAEYLGIIPTSKGASTPTPGSNANGIGVNT
jgi:hypothetical protein